MLAAGPLQPLENVLAALLVATHQTAGVAWGVVVALTIIVRLLLARRGRSTHCGGFSAVRPR